MNEHPCNVGFVELDLGKIPGLPTLPFVEGDPRTTFRELRRGGIPEKTDLLPAANVFDLIPWHRRTLRIALAMKGGLSLAVWIGGAVAELDILRRIRVFTDGDHCRALVLHATDDAERERGGPEPALISRAARYARLLAKHGYDRVEFDVLAGASAGGLNGVLYAVAQRAGVGFDTMIDTWLSSGAAWDLLQSGKPARFDAVMRGDNFFWPQLTTALTRLVEQRDADSPLRSEQVVVDLSATLLDAVDASDRTTAEGRAQFRFVGGRDPLDDRAVPPRYVGGTTDLDASDYADIARIAYAAKTTSAFPFVFEPSLIYSGTSPLVGSNGWTPPRLAGATVDSPDMRMVFNAHRPDAATQPFRVADGGLLDNIPIDRALNAVRNMPADEHSNRAILYLDPSPKETAALFRRPTSYTEGRPTLVRDATAQREFHAPPEVVREDVGSRIMGTVLASLRKRSARESRDDEIEEVDLVRATTSVAKARNELLAERIDGSALVPEREQEVAAAYAGYRAACDFELLAPALLHPGEWLLGTDLDERPELLALDRLGIVRVESAFRELPDATREANPREWNATATATATGRQALVDACLTTLSWIRAVEQAAFQANLLDALDDALDAQHPEHRPELRPAPGTRPPDPEGRIAHTAARFVVRRQLSRILREATVARDRAILTTLHDAFTRMQNDGTLAALSPADALEVVRAWGSADRAPDAARVSAWDELTEIVRWLLARSEWIDANAPTHWRRTPWSKLRDLTDDDDPGRRVAKLTAKQLPLLFGGSGIPQPISSVRFHRIGADVQPARALEYRLLMEDQLLRGYRAALARPCDSLDSVTVGNLLDEQTLRSTAKLAGLRAANVAGFLSRDWRRNDWWWGRLDAAAGIVEFFASLPLAPTVKHAIDEAAGQTPSPAPTKTTDVLTSVHDDLLRQLASPRAKLLQLARPATVAESDSSESDADRARFVRGTQGLESLSDSYRVAMTARMLRATSTALAQGARATSPKRLAHWVLRPLAVLLPAAVSPPRLIVLAGLLVCAALTIWPMTTATFVAKKNPDVLTGVIVAGFVALVAVRLVAARSSKRRHDRRIAAHTPTRIWTRAVIEAAERRAWRPRVALFATTLVLTVALIWLAFRFGVGSVLFWAVAFAFTVTAELTTQALQTVPPSLHRTRSRILVPTIIAVALVISAAWLTRFAAESGEAWTAAFLQGAPWEQVDWLEDWRGVMWHAIGAGSIAASVALTVLVGAYRKWRMLFAPVLLVALSAALVAAVVGLSVTPHSNAAGQAVEVVLVGWLAGTVLWWAPWWRGSATGPEDGPKDTVLDRGWVDTRVEARERAARRSKSPASAAPPTPPVTAP